MPEIDLSSTELFQHIAPEDLDALLKCLDVRKKRYQKGEILFLEGAPTSNLGIVLSGRIMIEMGDAWGGRSILGSIGPGGTFAEAYACVPGEPMLVTVSAAEDTTVMLVNAGRVLTVCPNGCEFHSILIQNLLTLCARKNLQLSRRMQHTAQKSIRGRLMSYFSQCAKQFGSNTFEVPYNRQQLADYLNVDRSALCTELSKMQRDGLIRYQKNRFTVCPDASFPV